MKKKCKIVSRLAIYYNYVRHDKLCKKHRDAFYQQMQVNLTRKDYVMDYLGKMALSLSSSTRNNDESNPIFSAITPEYKSLYMPFKLLQVMCEDPECLSRSKLEKHIEHCFSIPNGLQSSRVLNRLRKYLHVTPIFSESKCLTHGGYGCGTTTRASVWKAARECKSLKHKQNLKSTESHQRESIEEFIESRMKRKINVKGFLIAEEKDTPDKFILTPMGFYIYHPDITQLERERDMNRMDSYTYEEALLIQIQHALKLDMEKISEYSPSVPSHKEIFYHICKARRERASKKHRKKRNGSRK